MDWLMNVVSITFGKIVMHFDLYIFEPHFDLVNVCPAINSLYNTM